jgi:superfamily II RNA helicase
VSATSDAHRTLRERVPPGGTREADEILERFLAWVGDIGLEPYPQQEEAILELLADRHVVLSTPTGSGKSLVAVALHFKALCEGARSFYTAPVKALVSEKFFALCADFGAENVGMLTGDASINRDAPIICCTTEVLANMALGGGEAERIPYAVLDEFHYYADRARGAAWQVPLIALPQTLFLMMSATLGNTDPIERRLQTYTGRGVSHVHSDERPVPLDFEYRETPLHETLEDLIQRGLAPVYVVNFTQRECADRAQGLTSANFCSRDEKRRIAEAIEDFRFDTTYGRDLRRFVGHGVGVHHAGLLPKYRLLMEQLAQRGLLKVVLGTDTLGVGVNIPIRTVLFTRLSKYDGEKVAILTVREFKQIAGRAGRKGFDDRGSVWCQAPEHVIENRRLAAKAAQGGKRKPARKKKAPAGFVPWNEQTFRRLVEQPPEMLESRFDVTHGMIVGVLQREGAGGRDYRTLIDLVNRCHESEASTARLRRRAAALFRSLRHAGVVEVVDSAFGPPEMRVRSDLATDFSLTGTLSLYLVEAASALDPEAPDHSLVLLSLVEAIQENPRPILAQQVWTKKRELMARLKAEGVEYEERLRHLEEVTYDRPEEPFIGESFRVFAEHHPWVREESVSPKSIAREMFEGYRSFHDYVKQYALARSEGLLLRYLSQVHNTLAKSLPPAARTEAVFDAIAFFRTMLSQVDSSLVEAWEDLFRPRAAAEAPPAPPFDLATDARAFTARVRSEMLGLVAALARGDLEAAPGLVRSDPDQPWDAEQFEAALAPFYAEYGEIVFTPEARRAHHTAIRATGPRTWDVAQVLVDPTGDNLWALHGEVDLRGQRDPEGPLVGLRRIGT